MLTSAIAGDKGAIKDVLPWPTARLLLELIKRVNNLTTREEILQAAWKQHGAIPSQSNLNNHLTLLRKRFDFWGIDRKKLISIPRKGILLKVSIEIMDDTETSPPESGTESLFTHDIYIEKERSNSLNGEPDDTKINFPKPTTMVHPKTLIGIGMVLLFSLIVLVSIKKEPHASSGKSLQIAQCHVYPIRSSFIQLEKESKASTISSLKRLISENKLSCKDKKDIYVAQRFYLKESWIYVSECKLQDESNYSTCHGYYYSEK